MRGSNLSRCAAAPLAGNRSSQNAVHSDVESGTGYPCLFGVETPVQASKFDEREVLNVRQAATTVGMSGRDTKCNFMFFAIL